MMLEENWVSRIMLTTKLFFQAFCEKILISFKIMKSYYSQLNELTVFYSCEVSDTLYSCWNNASRMDKCSN